MEETRDDCQSYSVLGSKISPHGVRVILRKIRNQSRTAREDLVNDLKRGGATISNITDNARPHVAGVCQQFLQDEGIEAMDWPAHSPDLNPIEHIWCIMSGSIHQCHIAPQTVQELADALVQVWEEIPQETIRRVIRSMPRRSGQNANSVDVKLRRLLESQPQVANSLSNAAQKTSPDRDFKNGTEESALDRSHRPSDRFKNPVVINKDLTVRKIELESFSQWVEICPEMKRQRSMQEDTKRGNEGAAITETQKKPSEDEVLNKGFKDTSQYVVGELAALENEQNQIDTRAALVENRLRYLMDTGFTSTPYDVEEKRELIQ
ncbi:unnamed protein product [Ranitomeya imitator]|uniref:BMERB domain-containing protein n=1 Tax=Ranitomeya imitator TaxID=111125 RepID=A0ABN9LYJ2_9NEOB|nr:unnamed protein product [Ranitomeya imitator]